MCSSDLSNFTQIALRSEGFSGIGTSGTGVLDQADTGFLITGIRMPSKLQPPDTLNAQFYFLGPNITSVRNINVALQEITIAPGFEPINIAPYSMEPGTQIYAEAQTDIYSATFIDDGFPTVIVEDDGSCVLRVRRIDSSFPTGVITSDSFMEDWQTPFIKRWKDPRNIADAAYSLIIENTSPNHRDPAIGSVMRLNLESQNSIGIVRPGVQFDPAQTGGWGRVFRVAFSEPQYTGDSPQLNEVLINRGAANTYYTAM